jgi:L-alanine-DL-glutamate epimerase-like enolase superfamily enzyme
MMKITQTSVFVLGDPEPPGPVDERIDALAFLRVDTDEGISGLSEIFSVPPGVARAVLDGPNSYFGRQLIGESPITPEQVRTRLYNSMLHGNRRGWAVICMGAVEVALWDIYGKLLEQPVFQLLGGAERARHQLTTEAERREVIPYCTIIAEHWDAEEVWDRAAMIAGAVEKLAALHNLGYRAFKIEPLRSSREAIVEVTRRARDVLGPDPLLCVDVGYLWNDVGTALDVAGRLADHDVFFLETPFPVDALDAYRQLAEKTPLRIAAGEHTVTRWDFLLLMDHGGVTVVQPYMTSIGGLSEAKRVIDLAQPRGVLVCPGNWSTGVLSAATFHLAAYSPITPVFEYVAAEVYWSPLRRAIATVGLPVVGGAIALPTAPGIGIDLPQDLIEHFRID